MANSPTKKTASKKKLNKRILLVLIGVAAVSGVGLIYLERIGPSRNINAGDAAFAAKDFKKAIDQYGRAVRKKSTNLEYLEKYERALRVYVSPTASEARERYSQLVAVIASEARLKRDDPAAWAEFLEELEEQAALGDAASVWKSVGDTADEMLGGLNDGSPLLAIAQFHRGLSGFRRAGGMSPDERASTVADLTAAAAAATQSEADRAEALSMLARLHANVARIASVGSRPREAGESLALAQAAFDQLLAASPGSLQTRLAASTLRASGGTVSDALVELSGLAVLAAQATSRSELEDVLGVILSKKGGTPLALDVLEARLERFPSEMNVRQMYAMLLRQSDGPTAEQQARLLLDGKRPTTSLGSVTFEDTRTAAASLLFDIAYDAINATTDPTARAAAIVHCEETRKLLEAEVDVKVNPLPLTRVDGKLAFAKKDFLGALAKLSEVMKSTDRGVGTGQPLSREEMELVLLAAVANREIGERGQALYLISRGLDSSPGNVTFLRVYAQLSLENSRADDAIRAAEAVLSSYPDDPEMKLLVIAARNYNDTDITKVGAKDPIFLLAREVQELVTAKNYAAARGKINAILKDVPDDVRLVRMLATISSNEGPKEKALAEIGGLLVQFPGDSVLIRIQAFTSSEDPVERVRVLVDESTKDPVERAVGFYTRLRQESKYVTDRARNETLLALPSAAASVDMAKQLEAALPAAKATAIAADPFNPVLIEVQFQDALRANDEASIAALLELAKQGGRDATQIPIMQARMLLMRGDTRGAMQVLDDAIASGVDASTIYRALGVARQEMGDIEGAILAYEESYKRRPTDVTTARVLAEAWLRSGNSVRALQVLREIRRTAGEDSQIADMWLGLESTQGNPALARRMRATRFTASPEDLENTVAYVVLLASGTPDREDILDESGKMMFSELRWREMTVAEQTQRIDEQRGAWRDEALAILTDLSAKNPTNAQVAAAHSTYLRNVGMAGKATIVIDNCIAAAGPNGSWHALLLKLQDAYKNRNLALVDATVAEIIRRDDPSTRNATLAAGIALLTERDAARALPLFESVAQAQPSRMNWVRCSETALRVNEIARARTACESAVKLGGKADVSTEILGGMIEMADGDQKRNAGDIAGAKVTYEKGLPFFARGKELAPGNPAAFAQDAQLKRKLFELTDDRARADEALASADRAVQLGAAYFIACAVRSEVLLARGDTLGAVMELERFLKIAPMSTEARERYARLCLEAGQMAKAESALREGIAIIPAYAPWHIALGNLLASRGEYAAAAASFMRAAEHGNDINVFVQAAESMLRAKDPKGVLALARGRAELIRSSPALQGMVGLALLKEDDRSEALRYLRESRASAFSQAIAGNPQPLEAWHGALRTTFAPAELPALEALVTEAAGGTKSPWDDAFLSEFALLDLSSRARGITMIESVVASPELANSPMILAQLYDRLGGAYFMRKGEGDCGRAIGMFEKALELAPNADQVLNNYAYLMNECLGDPKKGLPAARRAVQMQPSRVEYLDTLAVLLIAAREPDEAITILGRAAGIKPLASASLHLAQAYELKGKPADAKLALQRARELNPDPELLAEINAFAKKLGS